MKIILKGFRDLETTSTVLISGLWGNSVVISSSYYYRYLNSTELIYTIIQKPTCITQIKPEDHSYQLSITAECKLHCSLLLKRLKLNIEYPADNQPQNGSVFFIWHTSVSVPEPIYCWRLCENLLSLFIQHHKQETLSRSMYPPANVAPVTWILFPCHMHLQQFIPVHCSLVIKCNSNTKYVGIWWWSNGFRKSWWKAIIKTKRSIILVWHHQSWLICTHNTP